MASGGFNITRWHADEILAKARRASEAAIDETLEESVQVAKGGHWWENRTGFLESQIVREDAKTIGSKTSGRFGATRMGFYGLFLERRQPFLRPAADITWRGLARAIARRLS